MPPSKGRTSACDISEKVYHKQTRASDRPRARKTHNPSARAQNGTHKKASRLPPVLATPRWPPQFLAGPLPGRAVSPHAHPPRGSGSAPNSITFSKNAPAATPRWAPGPPVSAHHGNPAPRAAPGADGAHAPAGGARQPPAARPACDAPPDGGTRRRWGGPVGLCPHINTPSKGRVRASRTHTRSAGRS